MRSVTPAMKCLRRACTRAAKARGLCRSCYDHARRTGSIRIDHGVGGRCPAVACERAPWCRGWCRYHYDQVRAHGRPTPERAHRAAGAACAVAGCPRKPCTRGRCQTHYHAWWEREGGWRSVMKVARRRAAQGVCP